MPEDNRSFVAVDTNTIEHLARGRHIASMHEPVHLRHSFRNVVLLIGAFLM